MERNTKDKTFKNNIMTKDIRKYLFKVKRLHKKSPEFLHFVSSRETFYIEKGQPVEDKILCVLKGLYIIYNGPEDKTMDGHVRKVFRELEQEEFLHLALLVRENYAKECEDSTSK